jgi:hypothetical protein
MPPARRDANSVDYPFFRVVLLALIGSTAASFTILMMLIAFGR